MLFDRRCIGLGNGRRDINNHLSAKPVYVNLIGLGHRRNTDMLAIVGILARVRHQRSYGRKREGYRMRPVRGKVKGFW